jgi:hypothetical protein
MYSFIRAVVLELYFNLYRTKSEFDDWYIWWFLRLQDMCTVDDSVFVPVSLPLLVWGSVVQTGCRLEDSQYESHIIVFGLWSYVRHCTPQHSTVQYRVEGNSKIQCNAVIHWTTSWSLRDLVWQAFEPFTFSNSLWLNLFVDSNVNEKLCILQVSVILRELQDILYRSRKGSYRQNAYVLFYKGIYAK